MPSAAAVARGARHCLNALLVFPVAWAVHLVAVLMLPWNVGLALLRSLFSMKGVGVDELLKSFFVGGGFGGALAKFEHDKTLLSGLRETHAAAVGALREQLSDSESRYKVRARRWSPVFPMSLFSKRVCVMSRRAKSKPNGAT